MKRTQLQQMFGTTPESFRQRVAETLEAGVRPARAATPRRALRLAAVCALCLTLFTAVAFAVFSPRVAEVFGQFYGPRMQERLLAGKSDRPEASLKTGSLVYTLHEVSYIDSGLYAVVSIRPEEGRAMTLAPGDDEAPAARGDEKLIVAEVAVDQIAVEDGPALPPSCYGISSSVEEDGSLLVALEIEAGAAVSPGESYTLYLWASSWEYGDREGSYQGEKWIVTVVPKASQSEKGA